MKKIFALIFVLFLISCSSNEPTGQVSSEPQIYAEPELREVTPLPGSEDASSETQPAEDTQASEVGENETIETETVETPVENETIVEEPEVPFAFQQTSMVNSQNGVSFSLDNVKHELKNGGEWGKIVEIQTTIYNENKEEFKPQVFVRFYGDKDPIDQRSKPKAQFDYDVESLKIGEHAAKTAIVNIPFRDSNTTKKFEIMIVDSLNTHRSLAYIEYVFDPLTNFKP